VQKFGIAHMGSTADVTVMKNCVFLNT